jgi:hypothetical protein
VNHLTAYFSHAESVLQAARPLGVQATVQLADHSLSLHRGDVTHVWRPKFITALGASQCYTDAAGPGLKGFAGWSPYGLRRWPAATNKIDFKRFAIQNDVRTPAACFDPALIRGPFLIKHARSSFGEGMRGPFLSYSADDPEQQRREDEYYENFLVGQIAKAWCWGSRCFALHVEPPLIVTGDGEQSLRELMVELSRGFVEIDWELIARLAAYCGVWSLDAALPAGKEVIVEYRYGSRYKEPANHNANVLGRMAQDAPLARHFADAAAVLATSIVGCGETDVSFYTLDAIIDSDGLPWFLEMNCNPIIHPDLYPPMIRGCFGHDATQEDLHGSATAH